MATALNPTRWDSGVSPAGAGSVSISWTDSSTTFRATANSGWKFDHWVFTPYGGQWMPQVQEDFSKNLNNATHVSGRYRFDPDVNPQYADAGVMGTAYFVPDSPGPDTVTITLVVHNGMGWGYVGFVGGQSSSQQISKTFPRGSQFTIEATRDPVNFSEFKIWRWRSGSISSTNSTITGWATADETYTAYFAFPITASARLLDDNSKPCPQGEVLITYLETPQTPWAQDVSYERTEPGIIRCHQRSTGGGWTFVKWLWRNHPSAEWYTSTNQDLLADDARRFEAIALFKRFATHLLVNSSARATPVRLTYDDRAGGTGLLVADY